MQFITEKNALIARRAGETLRIESWGKDSFRVRAFLYNTPAESDFALTEKPEETDCRICISQREDQGAADGPGYAAPFAEIENGRIRATVNFAGVISFYRDGNLILREYFRSYGGNALRNIDGCQILTQIKRFILNAGNAVRNGIIPLFSAGTAD